MPHQAHAFAENGPTVITHKVMVTTASAKG